MLFCTAKDFHNFNEKAQLRNKFPEDLKFLIFCDEKIDFSDILKTKIGQNVVLEREYFLIEEKNSLEFSTVEWFTDQKCNEAQLKTINRFDKRTQKWTQKLIKHQKFFNFHNCTLVSLHTYGTSLNFHLADITKIVTASDQRNQLANLLSQKVPILSRYVEFLNILKTKGNFMNFLQVQTFEFPASKRKPELVPHDGVVMEPHFELSFGFFTYQTKTFTHFISHQFNQREIVIVVTPGEFYSDYEKLVLPFDRETWICLSLTFLFAFLVIFIINRMPKIFPELIYGVDIHTPTLNVIANFFGIAQQIMPRSNGARMLLLCFTYFCLIFRTAYQGLLHFKIIV